MAAKAKSATTSTKVNSNKRKRPGVHSKKKNSVHKTGNHYKKSYKGQGR